MTLGGNAWIAEPKRWWAADVNGDGRDDLVWAGGSLDAATVRFRLAVATGGYGAEVDTGIAAPNGVGVPLDYDGDGNWSHPTEQILAGAAVLAGTTEFTVTVPGSTFSIRRELRRNLS